MKVTSIVIWLLTTMSGSDDNLTKVDALASAGGCEDGFCVRPSQNPPPVVKTDMSDRGATSLVDSASHNVDNSKKIKIEIISDTMCPWCWVGKRNLEKALQNYEARTNKKIDADINWLPFFLDRNLPEKGKPVKSYYMQNYGDPNVGERMKSPLVKAGKKCGIDFETHFVNMTHYRPTVRSHRLIEYAKRQGKQDDMVEELFHMYYEEGKHLNCVKHLVDSATKVGLNGDDVRTYLESHEDDDEIDYVADQYKSQAEGVPTFIFTKPGDSKPYYKFSGGQPPSAFELVFDKIIE